MGSDLSGCSFLGPYSFSLVCIRYPVSFDRTDLETREKICAPTQIRRNRLESDDRHSDPRVFRHFFSPVAVSVWVSIVEITSLNTMIVGKRIGEF